MQKQSYPKVKFHTLELNKVFPYHQQIPIQLKIIDIILIFKYQINCSHYLDEEVEEEVEEFPNNYEV